MYSCLRWLASFTLRPLHLCGKRPSVLTEWDWAAKSVDTSVKIKGCAPSRNLIQYVVDQMITSHVIDWAVLAQFYLLETKSEMLCGIFGAYTTQRLTWLSEWRKLLEYPIFCFCMFCSQYVFCLRLRTCSLLIGPLVYHSFLPPLSGESTSLVVWFLAPCWYSAWIPRNIRWIPCLWWYGICPHPCISRSWFPL